MPNKQEDHESDRSKWHDAYVSLRPLLYYALGRLARQGYSLEPSEAPELIHDFIAEAWPGLTKRFDPAQANFRTYLYGAFLRYARHRIVKGQKWRASLVSPEEMELFIGNYSDHIERSNDLALVKQILSRLPAESRKILKILTAMGYRERKAASTLGVTRHRFRRLAVEALAQFAIELNMSELVPQKDWPIAYALWAEGRSIEDAAVTVGMSPQRARIARRRILKVIEGILREFSSSKKPTKKREVTMKPCDLWQQFVANPKDKQLAAQLRDRADELLEHLQDCEACDTESKALESNLPEFYEALSATLEITDDYEDLEEFERAIAKDDARVKVAIESALLPAIRDQLRDRLFSIIKREELVKVFLACEALSMRIHRHAWHEGAINFVLMSEGLHFIRMENEMEEKAFLSRKELLYEMCSFANISENTAGHLFDWVIDVSRSFPKLMLGIEAAPYESESLRLILSDRDPTVNLYEYWNPSDIFQNVEINANIPLMQYLPIVDD